MSSLLDMLQNSAGSSGDGQQQESNPQSELDALQKAIDSLHTFVEMTSDDIDRQTALQCYAKLQQILANEQKQKEAAMGTTPAHKHLRKQVQRSTGQSY